MAERLIAYKVVRQLADKNIFLPAMPEADHSFIYRIGQTTKRKKTKNGPIALFSTINACENFIWLSSPWLTPWNVTILKVEYKLSRARHLWRPAWKSEMDGKVKYIERKHLPAGTILADEIKPIKDLGLDIH